MEYVKKSIGSSAVAKTGLALGATALGVGLFGGGGLGNFLGMRQGFAYPAAPGNIVTVDASGAVVCGNGYVTAKEIDLIRENGAKDAVIAKLEAKIYTDEAVKTETEPLKMRVCELEKATAVNAARDADFRRYVNGEFVHQPKAYMKQSIVVCKQCGCECDCCNDDN